MRPDLVVHKPPEKSFMCHGVVVSTPGCYFGGLMFKFPTISGCTSLSSIVLGFFNPMLQLKPTDVTTFCMQLKNQLESYTKALSLPNVVTSLVDFLTACKSLWCLCVLVGAWDSKNPVLYYSLFFSCLPICRTSFIEEGCIHQFSKPKKPYC